MNKKTKSSPLPQIKCNLTSHYGIFTIEIFSQKPNHPTHQILTDDIDLEFSKKFTEHIKIIQH